LVREALLAVVKANAYVVTTQLELPNVPPDAGPAASS